MENIYICQRFEEKIIIEKSKFISIIFPCTDFEEFKNIYKDIKVEYPKANHYIYAIRTETFSKSNDDGEPSGTAGKPTLELLEKKNLMNIAVITIRYFGGVKLGAGRLLRTYVDSAINTINSAKIFKKVKLLQSSININNSELETFKNFCKHNDINIIKINYNNSWVELLTTSSINLKDYIYSFKSLEVNNIEEVEILKEILKNE